MSDAAVIVQNIYNPAPDLVPVIAPDGTMGALPAEVVAAARERAAVRSRSVHRLQAHVRPHSEPLRAEIPTVRQDGTTAVIRLYDHIDSWGEMFGLSASEFADVIDGLPDDTDEINLLINSPGGEVTEGIAILNLLRNHPARTVAVVEGVAASAASFIAAGCDELIMSRNSTLMVHSPWVMCIGDAEDMRSTADQLDSFEANIASIYAAKAGGTVDEWRGVMHAETWFTADEAVEAGLADKVNQAADDPGPQPTNRWDLSIFNFAGRANAPGPQASATPPSETPRPGQEGASDMDLSDIREALGLADDTGDEDVLAAALDRLTEPAPPAPEASLPEGVVTVTEAQLAQLRSDAQAGRDAREAQMRAERESLVNAAVTDGRIAPAERDAWLAKLEAGTGAEQVLAALKPGVVPVNQIGHGGNVDLDTDDAIYAELFGTDTEVKA